MDTVPSWIKQKLRVRQVLSEVVGYSGKLLYAEHHLAHAASAFFTSPFEEAAVREAAEELPLDRPALTPLWEQTVEFIFRGESIRQVELYFLARRCRVDVALGEPVRAAHRREGIVASRWWSVEEIEHTPEQIFPQDLAGRLRGLRTE